MGGMGQGKARAGWGKVHAKGKKGMVIGPFLLISPFPVLSTYPGLLRIAPAKLMLYITRPIRKMESCLRTSGQEFP